MSTERSLVLVKPDGFSRGLTGEVIRLIEAKGYTLVMDATVRQGWLDGQYGKPGSANSLRLSCAIQADGQAILMAEGFTGNPQYSIDRVPSSSRYSYTLKSRFEARRGSGQRVEGRPCEAVFVRP